ncbi:MAG: hypothetical protein ACI4PM_00405 [Butyricicoccus sp.]
MKSEAEVRPRKSLTSPVNPKICFEFKDNCRAAGIPLNILIECFMRQYAEGEFPLLLVDNYMGPTTQLRTTVDQEVVDAFRTKCKHEGNTMKLTLESFMHQYNQGKYRLALIETEEL